MFEVHWTGDYPLCCGEWIILKNGKDVSRLIPDEIRYHNMNTEGCYSECYLECSREGNWEEIWEDYTDGSDCESWIVENEWISDMCDNHDEMVELFHAIQSQDWREHSCGGCI